MPFAKPELVSGEHYDYIVIGGGTAGLTVATRLAEDSSISVLVLEAGEPNLEDPKILIPAQFGRTVGDSKYDWAYKTVKQKFGNDRELTWARGKGLGGTSAMNYCCWVKPPVSDINAFEELGNPGWNWDDYFGYSKKVERFSPPTQDQIDLYPHTFDPNLRGTDGPIHVTIPHHVHTLDSIFQPTIGNLGLKTITDPYGGDINGTWICSSNFNRKTWTRSYAANAYLQPNIDRENLWVVTEAHVARVLLAETSGIDLVATGVEFIIDGVNYVAHAKKEVILSAGTINDPKILELSGIGRADVLKKIGVEQKIDLPGVGENVQEHCSTTVSFELKADVEHNTLDKLLDPTFAAQAFELHAKGQGILRTGITSIAYFPLGVARPEDTPDVIKKLEDDLKEMASRKPLPAGLKEQFDLQLKILKDENEVDCEIGIFPCFGTTISKPEAGKSYMTAFGFLNHPFSRGSIHAASSDALVPPEIDPHYFEVDYDLENLVQHINYIRTLANTEPWKSSVVREVDPGPDVTLDEGIRDYIKNNYSNTVGSCSMLPREKLGVVDPELKVYGTFNLRVVDLSIIPLHIAAHTQLTAYVIGEKAADIIKAQNTQKL